MLMIPRVPRTSKIRSVAVLTSGGDAPGMNAAIRSVVRYAITEGLHAYGIQRGYSGLIEGQIDRLELSSVSNIIQRGGTILRTSRCAAFHRKTTRREAANLLERKGIDALVVIGGDGSFRGAHLLEKETGFPVIGVPGTIDNDINGSDDTIGFDTAINTGLDAIDRIRDTASAHDRLFLVEVMGRAAGFIAASVGISGGAETIVVPEEKLSTAEICRRIDKGAKRGKLSSIVIVSEGARPGGAAKIARELERKGYSPRVCVLGHTQRGGSPTAHDRVLASTLGASAVAYLLGGHSDAMVGVQDDAVSLVPFKKAIGTRKPLPKEILDLSLVLAS